MAGPKRDPVGTRLGATFVGAGQANLALDAGKCYVFRKTFMVGEAPSSAVIHLFANSRYMLWINGSFVDRGPARFEPRAPEYDSIDIKGYLSTGRNSVSIMVTGPLSNGKVAWRPLGLAAEIDLGHTVFATDATWKWSDNTRYRQVIADWANIYDLADARIEDGDWTQTAYDDSKWLPAVPVKAPSASFKVDAEVDGQTKTLSIDPIKRRGKANSWWGPLTARRSPMLRETVVQPTWQMPLPLTLEAGRQVTFKFPHLVLAYCRIQVDAEAGSELELTYSPQTSYVCRAGKQEFITSDTHAIFEGGIRAKSGRITLEHVEFVERLYPFDRVGSFHSSDPLLNKLWTTCVRGLEITSEDAYVDCTDRERVEWMDCDPPSFDVTRVAMAGPSEDGKATYADPRLLEEMLRRTAYTLQPDGWVKAHTSSDRFDIHAKMEDRACDWVQGARRYYESCGKTAVIREIWPAVKAQMAYFIKRMSSRGLVNGREWVVWGNPVGYQTCEGTALNAFIYKAFKDAAYLGRIINKREDAAEFEEAALKIQRGVNSVLWDEPKGTYFAGYYDIEVAKQAPDYRPLKIPVNGNLIAPTMHAALFALDQGIVPNDRRSRVVSYLLANRPTDNSIMQYYYFFKQQYAVDRPDEDLSVINKMRVDWKDMAESPYEATFEGLHSWGSQAHCYGMFPAYFLSSYVLGVRLNGPTTKRSILIEPRLADLTEASGTVVTEFGPVKVEWNKTTLGGRFHVQSPEGVRVTLHLPDANDAIVDGKAVTYRRSTDRWFELKLTGGIHSGIWWLQSAPSGIN